MIMERLYEEKPDVREFSATVISSREIKKGIYGTVLDRTAFFPEGGGQPFDTGTLNGVPVTAVHERDGAVVHETDRPFSEGETVRGIIDWDRRFDHMQQHSGEHLLSGLAYHHYGYHNVGFHLEQEAVTVDFDGVLTPQQARQLEWEANELIWANRPVEAWYPSTEELESMDYRSKKALSGAVRLVRIEGGDLCACCGTHVSRTGEIGMVKITGLKKYKGGVRVEMVCGGRALRDYETKQEQVTEISVLLSAKQHQVAEAVEKLAGESAAKDSRIGALYETVFRLRCGQMADSQGPVLVFEEDLPSVQLRKFCDLLYRKGKGSPVLACSGEEGSYRYVLCGTPEDVKRGTGVLSSLLGGKGSGKGTMAQGMVCAARQDMEAVWVREMGKE